MNEEVIEVCISSLYGEYKRLYGREPSDAEVLDMARWAWPCRAENLPRLVFAEAEGEIKGVFEVVDEWFRCGKARGNPSLMPNIRPKGMHELADVRRDIAENRRMAFVGCISTRAGQYVGQRVPGFDNWHSFRYVTLTNGRLPQR